MATNSTLAKLRQMPRRISKLLKFQKIALPAGVLSIGWLDLNFTTKYSAHFKWDEPLACYQTRMYYATGRERPGIQSNLSPDRAKHQTVLWRSKKSQNFRKRSHRSFVKHHKTPRCSLRERCGQPDVYLCIWLQSHLHVHASILSKSYSLDLKYFLMYKMSRTTLGEQITGYF